MADQKISELTNATTPLAGTEVLPIVQSSATVKVAVSDLTAGRAVTASSLALTTALPVSSGGTGSTTSTGAGAVVLATSPTLVTPNIGAAVATTMTVSQTAVSTVTTQLSNVENEFQLNAQNGVTGSGAGTVKATLGLYYTGTLNGGIQFPRGPDGTTGWMNFLTAGVEKMRLDTAGNLGLNVVPVVGFGNSIQIRNTVNGGSVSAILHQALSGSVQQLDILNNALPPAGGYTAGYNYTLTGARATRYTTESGGHSWFISNAVGTAGAAVTFLERMRIDAAGNVSVGVSSIATAATDGFLYIPACAGIPTGTPTAKTGLAPMVVDSTNNKLYVYIGGAWRVMN